MDKQVKIWAAKKKRFIWFYLHLEKTRGSEEVDKGVEQFLLNGMQWNLIHEKINLDLLFCLLSVVL